MAAILHNRWNTLASFTLKSGKAVKFYSLPALEKAGLGRVSRLPFSIRVVLESLLRNIDDRGISERDVKELANWNAKNPADIDIPFKVSRVLMQDFTGVPAVVDLAAVRDYVVNAGKPPEAVEPLMRVDLIIDHSVQVDAFREANSIEINQEREVERNKERYILLKWANQAFKNFYVFPPGAGICHQVNLEYLATCVMLTRRGDDWLALPDTLVGTDSHTTMVDGLGVVGFGVGGIEAEAALLNQPVSFTTPKVVGVHLTGKLREGVTATDLALELTKILREKNVVNAFVEFFGPGVKELSLPDRATISNMCPEYGATISIFPVDSETINYFRSTGRSDEQIELVQKYYEAQGMFNADYTAVEYSSVVELALESIVPSASGPSNPKQTVPLSGVGDTFRNAFINPVHEMVKPTVKDEVRLESESNAPHDGVIAEHSDMTIKRVKIKYDDGIEDTLSDGDVVISAITSCTNTSNPVVMVGAGLLARNALAKGLSVKRKVKTSLAPGSRVVTEYLERAGLMEPLEKLGFNLVGYGCTTCIGNSGPLEETVSKAIRDGGLAVASVLSGNRNFESRIHTEVKGNYLMSPPLVVAFAIAGSIFKDLTKEPLAVSDNNEPVYLKDIWPSSKEIYDVIAKTLTPETFREKYKNNLQGVNEYWNGLESPSGLSYEWDPESTYIKSPPFFENFDPNGERAVSAIKDARVLALFGDSITTDHISPAGAILLDSPAGRYLTEHGVSSNDFNTYGTRRGNDEVMVRGTFANNRIKNLMLPGVEGGLTIHYPSREKMTIYDAAMRYKKENVPLVVLAGIEYGSGSSRDWAAKGPMLLGVKAVIAKSFERIHRSNLIGMGIIPLQFENGQDANTMKIDVSKPLTVALAEGMKPKERIKMLYTKIGASAQSEAWLTSRIDAPIELEYYKTGGVLNYVIKRIINE